MYIHCNGQVQIYNEMMIHGPFFLYFHTPQQIRKTDIFQSGHEYLECIDIKNNKNFHENYPPILPMNIIY